MSGVICLQGGAEFGRACRDMDGEVVATAPAGPVVVLAGAASPGGDYARASWNAQRYYAQWVDDDVVAAPDPREDAAGCLDVLGEAALIVLPGGSPRRLLEVLDGPVGDVVRDRYRSGATLSGASAGAMVLCERTIVPDGGGGVVAGLGLVLGLALPHFAGQDRWTDRLPADLMRWGLPECGGVLVSGEEVRAIGSGEPLLLHAGSRIEIPRDPTAVSTLIPRARPS